MKLNNMVVQMPDPDTAANMPLRLVLIDFGCAVMRGDGVADMNDQFEVHLVEATNFSLGNMSHLAPEVVGALARKQKLRRGSNDRVVVPLAGQDAFAAGVALCV